MFPGDNVETNDEEANIMLKTFNAISKFNIFKTTDILSL